jgi:hypothetical protein
VALSSDYLAAFKRLVFTLDKSYRFATNFALIGLIGTVIGSYFQYNAWRDEKALARYQDELASSIATFSEVAGALSAVMNLQQILFYSYKNAAGFLGPIDDQTRFFLSESAKEQAKEYFAARTSLRKNIDVLAGKTSLFIDRPVETDERRVELLKQPEYVVSDRDSLRSEGFTCQLNLPRSDPRFEELKTRSIDWNSARDQVATFYWCLDEIHNEMLFVRVWAQSGKIADGDKDNCARQHMMWKSQHDIELQTVRLNALIAVSTKKIEQLRLRDRPRGFLAHWFTHNDL